MTARPSDDPTELFTEERHCQVTPGDTNIDGENTGIPCTSLRPQCHAAADDAWPEDDSAKRFLAKAAVRAKPKPDVPVHLREYVTNEADYVTRSRLMCDAL